MPKTTKRIFKGTAALTDLLSGVVSKPGWLDEQSGR